MLPSGGFIFLLLLPGLPILWLQSVGAVQPVLASTRLLELKYPTRC